MAGFVKFYREIMDHPIVHKDNDYLAIWMYLLLNVNYVPGKTEFNYKVITVNPGQIVTGRKKIAAICKVNEHKVDRVLKRFESEQMIEQLTSPNKRLITVVNWSLYQNGEQQNEQPIEQHMSNIRATDEQHMSTIEERKNIRIKEVKKNNKKSDVNKLQFGQFNNVMLTEEEHQKIITDGLVDYIQRLDQYIESKGAKYKSHYATILQWSLKDGDRKPKKKSDPEPEYGIVLNTADDGNLP